MADSLEPPLIHCEVIQCLGNQQGSLNLLVLCMDRAGSSVNIIDRRFVLELASAVVGAREKIEAKEVDAVVLCSGKESSFLVGADIKTEFNYVGVQGHMEAYSDVSKLQLVLCQLESLSVPTIAVLNGEVLGGGLELALACDFRIADSLYCKSVGLPEVKIGVLPGAGGCVRLPRLIGLPKSLPLIVTGRTITSRRAKKIGLVDHILTSTQSLRRSSLSVGSDEVVYDYQWLNKVLDFLECREIGNQTLEVEKRGVTTAVSATLQSSGREGCKKMISEEDLVQSLAVDWEACEEKARTKYPVVQKNIFQKILDCVYHVLICSVTVLQIVWTVGLKMPAPYACLQTTLRCYYAGSWLEAMSLNALGLASLIVTPTSKGLMSLFLCSRSLKKAAVNFDRKPSGERASKFDCNIFVLASDGYKDRWTAFVQGLLYNGLAANLIVPNESLAHLNAEESVREHFKYSLKRRRLIEEEVDEMMRLLFCREVPDLEQHLKKNCSGVCTAVVINMSSGTFPDYEVVMRNIDSHFDKVVSVGACPGSAHQQNSSVLLNLGDPLRNNTMATEVTPTTTQTLSEDVRMISTLLGAAKKTPVVTPPTLSSCGSVGLSLLVSHWSLAASFLYLYEGAIHRFTIDRALRSAGYTRGPFMAMKSLGKDVLPLLSASSTAQARLKMYLEIGSFPSHRRRHPIQVSRQELADVFTLNLILSSLQAHQQCRAPLSETALDMLSVGGLVGFPPMEIGPLTYAVRRGRSKILEMCSIYTKKFPFLVEVCATTIKPQTLLAEDNFKQLYSTSGPSNPSSSSSDGGSLAKDLAAMRTEVMLLDHGKLRQMLASSGVTNSEVFVMPACVAFTIAVLCILLLLVMLILLVS